MLSERLPSPAGLFVWDACHPLGPACPPSPPGCNARGSGGLLACSGQHQCQGCLSVGRPPPRLPPTPSQRDWDSCWPLEKRTQAWNGPRVSSRPHGSSSPAGARPATPAASYRGASAPPPKPDPARLLPCRKTGATPPPLANFSQDEPRSDAPLWPVVPTWSGLEVLPPSAQTAQSWPRCSSPPRVTQDWAIQGSRGGLFAPPGGGPRHFCTAASGQGPL